MRRGSQTNEPPVAAPAVEQLADDVRIDACAHGAELGLREREPGRVLRLPGRELDRRARLAPDHDLADVDREDPGQRRGGERGDLLGIAQPAEVDEQPRERREVERSALAQLLGERRESLGERLDELRGVLGQGPFGLEVQRAHDEGARPQRDRELGDHARQHAEVVGIGLTSWRAGRVRGGSRGP